ncbi:hypothetical protein PAMP_011933 [Pampus punctatissimus]
MDVLAISGIQPTPVKDFDRKLEIRAEQHEHLRGRNNVTSCRSPTRDFDTKQIKNELKEKRYMEFLRRRSVSPDICGAKSTNCSSRKKPFPKTFSITHYSSVSKSETLHTNIQNAPTVNGHPVMILTPDSSINDAPSTSKWASLWSEQVTLMRHEKVHARKQVPTTITVTKESNQNETKNTYNRENKTNAQKTSIKSFIQTEKTHQKKILREASVQTESGLITVKESDIQQLADYLQEALWREDVVKKKLAALQESTSNLLNSSNKIWTAHCSEDLLRNNIKALEAQLQVSLQKLPKDGVKKLILQMEKQKLMYEEKALVALQKATQEKTEALTKAETMQEVLITTKAEVLRWQSLYEELKLNSAQLIQNQHLSNEQLQWLHSQIEMSRAREAELREEVASLRQEKNELQYNICLVEEDNQVLREKIQQFRDDFCFLDGSNESQDLMMQEDEPRLMMKRDSQVEEQLRHTREKLQLKERECEELQTELHAMEQECQSSQARLSQCRDELRQLSHRRSRSTRCGTWWRVCVFFLLLLAVAGLAMLWLWHPPFREQAEDLYSDIETRIDDYLREMASPQHSGCFRPI